MSPGRETWTEGWTEDGRHVHVDRDPYTRGGVVRVDGEEMALRGDRHRAVMRRRDGGTTEVETVGGRLFCFRGMGKPHWDAWCGERLHPGPRAIAMADGMRRSGRVEAAKLYYAAEGREEYRHAMVHAGAFGKTSEERSGDGFEAYDVCPTCGADLT